MMELGKNHLLFVFLVGLALAVGGCGDSGPAVGRVEGTVTLQGKPVQGVTVTIQPQQGRPSSGITNAEGKYEVSYKRGKPGAELGTHPIRLRGLDPPIDERGQFEESDQYEQVLMQQEKDHPIPKKYRDGSTKIEVKPGTNTFDFTM